MTATYRLAAKLLRDAATFFRNVGAQNPTLLEQMEDNAVVYAQVAALLEEKPLGFIDLSLEGDETRWRPVSPDEAAALLREINLVRRRQLEPSTRVQMRTLSFL